MKFLIWIGLLIPAVNFAQTCDLRDEKDRYNQDARLTTGFKEFVKGPEVFLFSVSADKTEVDMFFSLSTPNGICFDDYSRAIVTFEGGKQRTTVKNGGTTNCKGNFHFVFKNSENLPGQLNFLAQKKILTIQLSGNNEKKVLLTPTAEEQEWFMQMVNCVITELENLRKDTWKPAKKQ